MGLRLASLVVGLGLAAGLVVLLAGGYLIQRSAARQIVDPRLARFALVRALLADPHFEELERRASSGEHFDSVADFSRGIALSRQLYEPVEMFGRSRFRPRPGVTVINALVWTGLGYRGLAIPGTSDLRAALERCEVPYRIEFRTDARGFKPTGGGPEDAAARVVFLGDSFTEGLWVAPEATFASRFADHARKRGRPVAPLNLGVNGYGALEMHWLLERYAGELAPSLVVANLFPNDVGPDAAAVIRGRGTSSRAYRRLFSHLAAMVALARTGGFRFAVALVPTREQVARRGAAAVFQERVTSWCESIDVPCLDPRIALRETGARAAYFPWDPHFTPAGHDRYAEFLADALFEP